MRIYILSIRCEYCQQNHNGRGWAPTRWPQRELSFTIGWLNGGCARTDADAAESEQQVKEHEMEF
jgi:hypothetical protein